MVPSHDSNPRPINRKSNALPIAQPHHLRVHKTTRNDIHFTIIICLFHGQPGRSSIRTVEEIAHRCQQLNSRLVMEVWMCRCLTAHRHIKGYSVPWVMEKWQTLSQYSTFDTSTNSSKYVDRNFSIVSATTMKRQISVTTRLTDSMHCVPCSTVTQTQPNLPTACTAFPAAQPHRPNQTYWQHALRSLQQSHTDVY